MKLMNKIRVKNNLGLHTRPATEIVKLLRNCKSTVMFTCKGETINAKSILSILMLAAGKNAMITVEVEGEDSEEIMRQLEDAFESKFGEQ